MRDLRLAAFLLIGSCAFSGVAWYFFAWVDWLSRVEKVALLLVCLFLFATITYFDRIARKLRPPS